MPNVFYLTSEGLKQTELELVELKGTRREELSKRLRSAIQQGDLSENADYIQAKEEQAFLEGRIQDLEAILRNYEIIDDKKRSNNEVNVGSHVTIQEDGSLPETYFLVGPKEARPGEGRISHESPIGKTLLGHRTGDTVIVETPNGNITFKIIKIE